MRTKADQFGITIRSVSESRQGPGRFPKLSVRRGLFRLGLGLLLGMPVIAPVAGADLLFKLTADGGGRKEFHHPDGWWQTVDYNSRIRLLFKLKSPVRMGDIVESLSADVTGGVRFYGHAEDHFFGETQILDFDLDRSYDLRNKPLFFYYWVGTSNVDYVGLPLSEPANPPSPRLDGLKFIGDLGILTNVAPFPNFWWFDRYFPVYATASLVTDATDFNGNVRDQCSGAPLANASVELKSDYGTFRAVTDSQGNFSVTQIPPGPLTISIARPGYSTFSETKPLPPGTIVNVAFNLSPLPTRIDPLFEVNAGKHHTDGFASRSRLVSRRGENIVFQWQLTPGQRMEDYSLQVLVHDRMNNPAPDRTISLPPANPAPNQWWARHLNTFQGAGGSLVAGFEVHVPPQAPVGEYDFTLLFKPTGSARAPCSVAFPVPIVVLFNPWCGDDAVYMADNLEKAEYLLREDGLIFRNKYDRGLLSKTKAWRFKQFDANSLNVLLELLESASDADRSSPTLMAQLLARNIRASDEGDPPGILIGNWSHSWLDYQLHRFGPDRWTDPEEWHGSDEIFKEYLSAHRPVKFGQCWVFAGVLTSLLRSAGIPARPITNFKSPQDINHNGLVDFLWLDGRNVDSIAGIGSSEYPWDFHVWCEAWMVHSRYAKPAEWQAVDATEKLGPAPRSVIRDDHQGPYEARDIFVAVAGPVVHHFFVSNPNGPPLLQREAPGANQQIGVGTCTKSLTGNRREPIVRFYEVEPAFRLQGNGATPGALHVALTEADEVALGSNVAVRVNLTNPTEDIVQAHVVLAAAVIAYNGIELHPLNPILDTNLILGSGQQISLERTITPAEYFSSTLGARFLRTTLYVEEVGTSNIVAEYRTVSLTAPGLISSVSAAEVEPGATLEWRLAWTNLSSVTLSNAILRVTFGEGLRLGTNSELTLDVGAFSPGQALLLATNILALKQGKQLIVATLSTDKLGTVDTYSLVRVGPPLNLRLRMDSQGRPVVAFATIQNEAYTIEATPMLLPSTWQVAGESVIGNNQEVEITLQTPMGPGSQFYRVRIAN